MTAPSRRRIHQLSRALRKGLRTDLSKIARGIGILLGRSDAPTAQPTDILPDPRIDPSLGDKAPTITRPSGSTHVDPEYLAKYRKENRP